MARRILSADAALVPHAQEPLNVSVRTESPTSRLTAIQARWIETPAGPGEAGLFDWERRDELMAEIAFVNRAQEFLDEAAVKIAPSVLRIVLTVKHHIPRPAEQRAFLTEHLDLDFRRISELCIVADSYRLLDPEHRAEGEAEIVRYGWSKSIKLAHVPDPAERGDIWERACAGGAEASYRAVLEEIRRFRQRKRIGPALISWEVGPALDSVRRSFATFERLAAQPASREECSGALEELGRLRKELDQVQRALEQRIDLLPLEHMAEEMAAQA